MCSPKSSPYWKSNSSWPDFSTGIASLRPCSLAPAPGCRSRTARRRARRRRRRRRRARRRSPCPRRSASWRRRSSPSPPASGRPRSRTSSSGTTRGGRRRGCRACRRSRGPWSIHLCRDSCEATCSVVLYARHMEPKFTGPELHGRHRGGADDPRPRDARRWSTRSRRCSRTSPRRRDQARADGVGARDRDQAVRGHARGRRASCAALRRQVAEIADAQGPARSARPARTRSRAGRTSGSPAARATATWSTRCASSRARSSSSACTSTSASTTPTRRSTSPTGCACTCRSCSRCRANSPFWRGDDTGLASTRMPIFRAFPRVGIPPYYDGLGGLRARGSTSWSRPA